MFPAFQRGDLLFLAMNDRPFTVGEVVVFKIPGKEIPIVHRILKVHEMYDHLPLPPFLLYILLFLSILLLLGPKPSHRSNGTVHILTKGDWNELDDSYGIYASGQQFLGREHIIGRVKAYVPLHFLPFPLPSFFSPPVFLSSSSPFLIFL